MRPGTRLALAVTSVVLVAGPALASPTQAPDPADSPARTGARSRVEALRRLVDEGYYAEAEERGRELLEELGSAGEGEGLAAAEASQWLASALRRTATPRAAETLRFAQAAVERKRELLGAADPSYAEALQELGTLYLLRGEAQAARELLEQACAIQEQHGSRVELGLTLARLATCSLLEQDLRSAESFLDHAAATLDGLPEGRVNDSWRLLGEAILSELRLDFSGARETYRLALDLREEVLRPDHPLVGQSCYDLARCLELEGDYAEAKELLERALAILREAHGEGHRLLFGPLHLMARIHDQLGASFRAWPLYESALELLEGTEALPCRLNWTRSLAADESRRSEGLEAYGRYFARCRELGPSAESHLAHGLISFGQSMAESERLQAAAEAYAEARSILERQSRPDPFYMGLLLDHEASFHLRLGDFVAARDAARQSLEIQEGLLGRDHLGLMWPLLDLARAQLCSGDAESAFASAARVEEISRRNLLATFDGLEGSLAARYAAKAREMSQEALCIALESGHGERIEWAFDAFIRRRALVLDELALRARSSRLGNDAESRRLAQELQRARSRLANLAYRIEQPTPDYLDRLRAAQREKEHLESLLARASRPHGASVGQGELGLEDVRAGLPRGTALVSYCLAWEKAGEPGELPVYLAFVLPAPDARVRLLRLGSAREIEAEIGAWRESLLRFDPGAEPRLREAGQRVRERIWAPVSACAADASRVVLVPDGALHQLSFAALPCGDDRYLIEEPQAVRYLTAEREIVPAKDGSPSGRGLLVVGSPRSEAPGERPLPVLDAAEQEAREVARLWSGRVDADAGQVRLLLGAQATEAAVLREAAGKRALHVACHSFTRRARPPELLVAARGDWGMERPESTAAEEGLDLGLDWSPLVEQGLLLAPASDVGDDGFLSAEELAGFDFGGVEWAVLAACSSGEGRIEAGEGVLGLQRALRLAGVRTTVTSLWPVEDEATRAWTREFYAACTERGLSAADAAADAARTVLERRRSEGKSTHPFYWAAFVAAGGCAEDPETGK